MPMSPDELRAEAKRLYNLAATDKNAEERLVHVLRALEFEADAVKIERQEQQPAQQQQQIQPKDDGKE
jgi:hypothetical protein